MKLIDSTRFSKIGTNYSKYIDNYLKYLNHYDIGTSFEVNNLSLREMNVEIFCCNSITTFKQNIECWVSLGFFILKDKKLIKIIPKMKLEEIYRFVRGILLVESNDKNINMRRNTCLIKILYLCNVNVLEKSLKMRNRKLTIEDIQEEIGEFERILIEDHDFVKILKIMWGNYEN